MNFVSQAGQDRFINEVLVKSGVAPVGSFIDIGCAGLDISNTVWLESIGWRGTLVDVNDQADKRPSTFIKADATKMKWENLPPIVDYLSLDVDEASLDALKNLPLKSVKFRAITIEHDAYRFGDTLRPHQRKILTDLGYDLLCADVCNPVPFEDWYVNPSLIPSEFYERFRSTGKHWFDILR